MTKVLYFLLTFLESIPAVFGIRAPFETPPYTVLRSLGDGIEIRAYGPAVVVETKGDVGAFQRLFDYIAGANGRDDRIAMTTPVEQIGGRFAGIAGAREPAPVMRFSLPESVAKDPPPPRDPRIEIVSVPARTVAVLRFSGSLDADAVARKAETLAVRLADDRIATSGPVTVLGYDPPFTIPFLRRNEVAIAIAKPAGS